jgi:hypothetical protein
MSVDNLSERVTVQHNQMNANVETFNSTIKRQNLVIACIQQEFKATMTDLYRQLGPSPVVLTGSGAPGQLAPPTPQAAVLSTVQQLGGTTT